MAAPSLRGLVVNVTDEPQRELAIPAILNDQEKLLGSAWGLAIELEHRLQCVSRPEPACPQEKDVATPVAQTVMHKLQTNNRGIQAVCDKLQNMIRLLEV